MEAVVLAAGVSGGEFQKAFGTKYKCLVEVVGRPIVRRMLDALHGSAQIDRIIVVGPEQPLRGAGVADEIIANDTGSYADSMRAGLDLARGERALVIAADVPLLQADHVDRYLRDCRRADIDVCFPFVSWEKMQAQLPGVRKTWYDLRDGRCTKGNAVVVRREALLRRLDRAQSLFEMRKKKQWAGLIGPSFLSRLLTRALSRRDVELALSSYLGLRLRSIEAAPELAADVDEVGDADFAAAVLARRRAQFGDGHRIARRIRSVGASLGATRWLSPKCAG